MNKLVRLGFPALTIDDYDKCRNKSDKYSTVDLENIETILNAQCSQDKTYLLELKNMSSLIVSTLDHNLAIDTNNRLQCDEDGIYEENRYSPHKVIQESSEIIL